MIIGLVVLAICICVRYGPEDRENNNNPQDKKEAPNTQKDDLKSEDSKNGLGVNAEGKMDADVEKPEEAEPMME